MKTQPASGKIISTLVVMLLAVAPGGVRAESTNTTSPVAADADAAWKELQRALQPPSPPAEWQGQRPTEEQMGKFMAEQGRLAAAAADKAKDFYTRFPDHAKAATAREKYQSMLQVAIRLGNTNRMAELELLEAEKLKDPKLDPEERFALRMQAVSRSLAAKRSGGEAEYLAAMEKVGRELSKEFPKREEGWRMLLSVAGNGDATKSAALIKELLAGNAPEEVKTAAEGLQRKMDALGKPVDIAFTAVDGRAVDLGKMKGKVVLVDFWATWCGPCVAEIPNVVKAYEKLHAKGFEIVGISFERSESDKARLVKFVADRKMPWPQYFDGKFWDNKFGQQYGINGIPAMWLVDKKGVLRDMNARADLEAAVEKLLAE